MPVEPTILAGAVAELAPILKRADLDFESLLEKVDIDLQDLEDPDTFISLSSVCELLERAAEAVGDDAFGVVLAQRYPPGSTGLMGYAAMTAPTLRISLQDVQRYTRLLTPQLSIAVDDHAEPATVTWKFPDQLPENIAQYASITIAMLVQRIRLATGEDWLPSEVQLQIAQPRNVEPFHAVFGDNLTFGSNRSFMVLSGDILDLPMPGRDERLHRLLRELGDYRLSKLETASQVVDRTQDKIIALLNHGPVSLEMVARDLGQSGRSLQRRLKEEGTTFQIVLEKTRRLMARHYLRSPQHTLAEIAFLLGFSEQSAFTRACKRWFGATPYEMRTRLRGGQ